MINWHNVTVKLKDLTPWEHNPKSISKAHAKRLLDYWQRVGQFQSIAIGPGGEVYDGHQRLSVLRAAYGDDYEIDARQSDIALTDEQRKELVIAAHVGTTGQFDWDALSGWDASQLQEWGMDGETLASWRADATALTEMLAAAKEQPAEDPGAQIDRADELREKWGVETGQLWRLGEHRLICGDCTDKTVVDRVMGGEKVSLIVTDPPYGVNYDGGANNEIKREKLEGDVDAELYKKFLQVAPISNECALYMWHADRRANEVYEAAIKNGFEVRSQIIWHKLKAHYGAWMAQYKQKHEPCIYCVKGAPVFSGATNEVTVWEYEQPSRNEFHPTQKPIELMERAISNHPYPIIYEPFCGSGTTLIACERLGRKCRAVEISPAYVAVAIQRWVDMTGGVPELIQ